MTKREEWLACGPNMIGATGGSGTRALALVMLEAGMFIGVQRNRADDALAFVPFLDRWINPFLAYRKTPLWPAIQLGMRWDLRHALDRHLAPLGPQPRPWGSKNPRAMYVLPFLDSQWPNLRFLHLVRDGRDMAFSKNQNQLQKHGRTLLGPLPEAWSTPARSIALWSRINTQVADYGEARMPGRYLWLRFEDLCAEPARTVRRALEFFGLQGDAGRLAGLVAPPASLGRWRQKDPQIVAELHRVGRAALQRFGYDISG